MKFFVQLFVDFSGTKYFSFNSVHFNSIDLILMLNTIKLQLRNFHFHTNCYVVAIKHAHDVTSIKQSPVLKYSQMFCPVKENVV